MGNLATIHNTTILHLAYALNVLQDATNVVILIYAANAQAVHIKVINRLRIVSIEWSV